MSEQRFSLLSLLERHQNAVEAFSAFSGIFPINDEVQPLTSLLVENLEDSFHSLYLAMLKLDSSTAESGAPLGSDLVVDDAR